MANTDDAETEVAETEKTKKKGPPLLFIGIAAGVIVLAGGAGAYFMIFAKKPDAHAAEKKEEPKKKKAEKKEGGEKEKPGPNDPVIHEGPDGVVFYTLPPIVANMQSSDGRATYLKLKLTFELPNEAAAETVTANGPRLQDAFQALFRELRIEDLQGSQGSYQVRMEILRRVNLIVAPTRVNSVLIEEMLIN
jgi:flagellar FliL protein